MKLKYVLASSGKSVPAHLATRGAVRQRAAALEERGDPPAHREHLALGTRQGYVGYGWFIIFVLQGKKS